MITKDEPRLCKDCRQITPMQIVLFAWLPLVIDDVTLLPLWLALVWWAHGS